jgi:predicted RNA-binding Zn ribbon-like protein
MPLVGGALCLDFVNTTGARASETPRERLVRFADLLAWCQRTGILNARPAARSRRQGAHHPDTQERLLVDARSLREDLFAIFVATASGRRCPANAVERLADRWRRAQRCRTLEVVRDRFALTMRANVADFDRLMTPVVTSAVDLLTSNRLVRVKKCAECDWLFVDESKNGSRRWCKDTCGNRVRSRHRYARRVRRRKRSKT